MVWDKNRPYGTDPIHQGDDVIRELKADLENAFKTEFGSSWDGTVDNSIHNWFNIPELNINRQIKLRQYSGHYYSLDIFLDNQWIRGTQIVDLPVGSKIISDGTYFGWQTVSLDKTYLLVLRNVQTDMEFFGSGISPDETIIHSHSILEYTLEHKHDDAEGSCEYSSDGWDYGKMYDGGKVWHKDHTHPVSIIDVSKNTDKHKHDCLPEVIKFNIKFTKIIKRVI